MCMRISPINIQQNQISHKAVNQKLLNEAVKEYINYKPYHNLLPLIGSIVNRAIYRILSPQDAIDTLEAIKPYAQNQSVVEAINDKIKVVKGISTR